MNKWIIRGGIIFLVLFALIYFNYSNIINLVIPKKHRPEKISYESKKVSDSEFESIA